MVHLTFNVVVFLVHMVFLRKLERTLAFKANADLSGRSRGFWTDWRMLSFKRRPADRTARPVGAEASLSQLSVLAEAAVQGSLLAQLCWAVSILTEVYTNV